MHDEVSCEPLSSRLGAHGHSHQLAVSESEIKSLHCRLESGETFSDQWARGSDAENEEDQHIARRHKQMASEIIETIQEAEVGQGQELSAPMKRPKQHQATSVKMESKLQEQQQRQQQQQESDEQSGRLNGGHFEEQKGAPICAACSGPIRDKFIFSVNELLWHQDCVKCAECGLKLHERCFTVSGKLYCRHDYWRHFGPKCFNCHEPINKCELVQRINDQRVYHLKCFTCSQCNRRLECGEHFHLFEEKQLLCKQDYQQLAPSGQTATRNQKQQQQQQKSIHTQRNGSTKNGFSHQNNAANNNNNSSYFTLLSPNQSRAEGANTTASATMTSKLKRSSLTSLDNMQDERQELEPDDELEPEEGEDDDDDLLEHNDELQQEELEEEADDEVDTCDAFASDQMDLENEENRTGASTNSQHQLGAESTIGNSSNKSGVNSAQSLEGAAAKRRRRRRRNASKESGNLTSATSRASNKGQSILNGTGAQSGSILASMQASGQQAGPTQALKCFSSSSTSSSSSTASNHSSASSGSATQLAPGQQAASQQHQQQQQQHHHHHQQHQSQQQHPAHHLASHQQHNASNQNSNSLAEHQATGAGHKPTRVRTVLNEKQLQTLRDCYAMNPRPDALMKEQLVDMTGLSPRVIRVWFQNKRCKDKKKSIMYKQMQQHEKDGRHLAGLTHIRGVPLVASSPIQYHEEQSSQQAQSGDSPQHSVQSPAQMAASVQPPPPSSQQQHQGSPGLDIHTYQPPWKSLIDYAHQQQQQQPPAGAQGIKQQATAAPPQPPPPERPLNTTSPRYQQLMGQMHGYSHASNQSEPPPDHQVLELQPPNPQQQQQQPPQYSQAGLMLGHQGAMMQQPQQQPAGQHLHAHLTQMGGPVVAAPPPPPQQVPAAPHHLHQFQH